MKLIHVSGAIFTDPKNGATVDADRLLADYRRLQAEAQQLREAKVEALEALAGIIDHTTLAASCPAMLRARAVQPVSGKKPTSGASKLSM